MDISGEIIKAFKKHKHLNNMSAGDASIWLLKNMGKWIYAKDQSETLQRKIRSMRQFGFLAQPSSELVMSSRIAKVNPEKQDVLSDSIQRAIKDKEYTVEQLADKFNVAPKRVREAIVSIKKGKFNIVEENNKVQISTVFEQGGQHKLDPNQWMGNKLRFGLTSDNHLCNKFAREDVLNMLYDRFEQEGITAVYNCGNWVDGEAKFNKNDLFVHGLNKQIEYAVEHYPYRKGIKTYFITADDHEGWWSQASGIDIGGLFQLKREEAGKKDLVHLGYCEADVDLNAGQFKEKQIMRLVHPGGGSAYSYSYRPQKIVESYQGGNKPAVLCIGHYHKSGYNPIRNVHTIQVPCTEDQTVFMRKKAIEAHVGGVIVDLTRDSKGIINSCLPNFILCFNKEFYEKTKYYFVK